MRRSGAILLAILAGGLATQREDGSRRQNRDLRRNDPTRTRQFDETVRQRDAAFAARDLDRLMAFYRDDAIEIDPSGAYHEDRQAITRHLAALFELEFTASFVELKRMVDGDTALLALDSRFDVPSLQIQQHFLTALTFTYEREQWKVLLAANTMLPK